MPKRLFYCGNTSLIPQAIKCNLFLNYLPSNFEAAAPEKKKLIANIASPNNFIHEMYKKKLAIVVMKFFTIANRIKINNSFVKKRRNNHFVGCYETRSKNRTLKTLKSSFFNKQQTAANFRDLN